MGIFDYILSTSLVLCITDSVMIGLHWFPKSKKDIMTELEESVEDIRGTMVATPPPKPLPFQLRTVFLANVALNI